MNPHIPSPLKAGNAILVYLQVRLNAVFSSRLNPMYNLGALGYFFTWTLLISGLYLFIFYDVSLGGAYNSVQRLTVNQKYYGGIIRSIHRYASNGLMAVMAVHALQTLFSDRFRKYRWFAWVSGVFIIPVVWVEGVTGYLMVFDESAKMALVQLAGWLDAFPLAIEPFSRNFIQGGAMNSLVFFVLTYLHIFFPIGLMIFLWLHCMRISRPLINAPKELVFWLVIILFAISVLKPAVSGPPANLSALAASPEINWFYLFPFPLADALSISPSLVLLLFSGCFFLLALAPWIIPGAPARAAVATAGPASVALAHCTGCEQCQKACPFEAINIKTRSDGRPYENEVEILPERCASCGLCLPACPFPAISVGSWTKEYFSRNIKAMFPNGGAGKIIIFACERAADASILGEIENAAVMTVPCIGILGVKTIEESLRAGVEGVIAVSCVAEDCHYRFSRRKLDITHIEIAGVKQLKIIEASISDPRAAREEVRKAQDGFTAMNKSK